MKGSFIATLTVEEFVNALAEAGCIITRRELERASRAGDSQKAPGVEVLDFSDSSRYGCGLKAIENRYHVSHLTAQRLKDGPLAPAIYQTRHGGKMYIDFEKADTILKEKQWRKKGHK